MTPEALEKLVKRGTVAELARAVSGLTEQERRSLSKTGETLYRQITRGDITVISRDRTNPYAKASLVALAVCPLSMVKRINLWNVWQEEEALCRILIDRRPDWADGQMGTEGGRPDTLKRRRNHDSGGVRRVFRRFAESIFS